MIRAWLRQRKARKTVRDYIHGFDWAAGVLIRGEMTVEQIEGHTDISTMIGSHTAFDTGAVAACSKLLQLGVVE